MSLFRKRKYPIKKDKNGLSARQRAFSLFSKGQRPSQVINTIPISLRTACRYYEDFKKFHHRIPYKIIRKWMRQNPEFSDKVINILAASLNMDPHEVLFRSQKPWGVLEALKGRWPDYRLERERTEIEDKLLAALEIIKFAEVFSTDPRFVRETIQRIIIEQGAEPTET